MDVLGCFDVPVWLILCIAGTILLYTYGTRNHSLFSNIGIPGPKPVFFLGNSPDFTKYGLLHSIDKWHKKYGDVFGIYVGSVAMTCVFDIDVLKEVLVKQFSNFSSRFILDLNQDPINKGLFFEGGSTWKRQRTILSPTFTGGKLRLITDHIQQSAVTLSNIFEEFGKSGKIADVKSLFGDFTMDVIASTAFSIEVDSQRNPDNKFVYYGKKIFSNNVFRSPIFMLATVFPVLVPLFKRLGFGVFPTDSITFFTSTMRQMIAQRKQESPATHKKHIDFLQLMLNAECEELPSGSVGETPTQQELKRLSTDEIIAQGFLFFLAGYTTTSTLLQFISYSLATNPHVQEKLIQEITEQLQQGEVNYDSISKLQYMENVIYETLRMYPSVIAWENKSEINPISFLAFGYGPRICIGMRLALLEVKVALVQILKKVKFVRLEDTQDVMTFNTKRQGLADLVPEKTIMLKVELR